MLILARRPGERLMIGTDVIIEVLGVRGNHVRIGITAPKDMPVHREEVHEAILRENAARPEAPNHV